jgi:hypothetical protein
MQKNEVRVKMFARSLVSVFAFLAMALALALALAVLDMFAGMGVRRRWR